MNTSIPGESDALENTVGSSAVANTTRRVRKKRKNLWLLLLWVAILTCWAIYVFVWPQIAIGWYEWTRPGKLLPPSLQLDLYTRTMLRTLEFFAVCWFFYVGASFGSFLNVVAWRMPRGITIVRGGSKCPYCCTGLSRSDNLPILGWIKLKGRCRTCRLPIDVRYVLVEVLAGVSFLWIALRELFPAGLTDSPTNLYSGVVWIIFYTKWDLVAIYVYHCSMVFSLMTIALITRARLSIPRNFAIFAFLLALVPPYLFKDLQLVAWSDPWQSRPMFFPQDRQVLTSLFGLLAGCLLSLVPMAMGQLGRIGSVMIGEPEQWQSRRWSWIIGSGLIGLYLGWQAALVIGVGWLVCYPLFRWSVRLAGGWSLLPFDFLVLVTIVHQGYWRFFFELLF